MYGLKVDLDYEPLGSIKRRVSWSVEWLSDFQETAFTVIETPKGKMALILRKMYVYVKTDMSNHVLHLNTSYNAALKQTSELLKRNSIIVGLISMEITCPKEFQCMTANTKYYVPSPKWQTGLINSCVGGLELTIELCSTFV